LQKTSAVSRPTELSYPNRLQTGLNSFGLWQEMTRFLFLAYGRK